MTTMTSPDNMRSARDKEMSAIMYNMKEQRVLEKCLHTLHLQQNYSMKLLELNNREIRVQYKKLKDKVSKIKSYLPVEDISKFRQLDKQSKINTTCDTAFSISALKMAAASRRLNLFTDRSDNRRSARSALPRISIQMDTVDLRNKSVYYPLNPSSPDMIKPSSSVNAAVTETQQCITQQEQRIYSVQQTSGPLKLNRNLQSGDEDLCSTSENNPTMTLIKEESLAVPEAQQAVVPVDRTGQSCRAYSAYYHTHSPFSSHVATAKDARSGLSSAPEQNINIRRLSIVSHDSIDSNLGENIFEERRQELLEEENLRAAALDKRTRDFLKQVDDYLVRQPRLQSSQTTAGNYLLEPSHGKPRSYDSLIKIRYERFQSRNHTSESDAIPTYLPENKYKERLMALWKNMDKCRYLRMPDNKLDLAGINTLAKDSLKLFQVLKHGERAPLREAWEN